MGQRQVSRALLVACKSSVPPYTCITSWLAIPPPLPSGCRPKLSAPPHCTGGETEAWREWSCPSHTANQQQNQNPDSMLSPHCLPPLHLPPSVPSGGGPSPAEPAGEAPEYLPACEGPNQDPGGHVGTRNSAWQGGRTWLLMPTLPWTLSEKP